MSIADKFLPEFDQEAEFTESDYWKAVKSADVVEVARLTAREPHERFRMWPSAKTCIA